MNKSKLKKKQTNADMVNHPAHYNAGRIEVIEAIEDWGLQYHRGTAVKYIARAGRKDASKEVEDLQKAIWYLNRECQRLIFKAKGQAVPKPDNTPIAKVK